MRHLIFVLGMVIKNAYAKKENMIIEENRKKQQAGLDKAHPYGY